MSDTTPVTGNPATATPTDGPPVPEPLAGWFQLNGTVLCESLRKLGAECGTE